MPSRAFVLGSACGAILGVTAGWLLWNSSNSETVSSAQPVSASFAKPKPSKSIGTTATQAAETGGGSSLEDQDSPQPNSSASASHVRHAELDALRPMIELGYMFPELVSNLKLDAETGEGLMTLLSEHLLESRENPPFVPAGQLEWSEYDKPQWVLRQEAQQRRQNAEIAAFLSERRERFSQCARAVHRRSCGARGYGAGGEREVVRS